jgi:peptidoglycan/LPS O-acetylase OafA/YrhL
LRRRYRLFRGPRSNIIASDRGGVSHATPGRVIWTVNAAVHREQPTTISPKGSGARRAATIGEQFAGANGYTTGFDYLRIGLALAVLCWHSIWISGSQDLDVALWSGPFRVFPAAILPMFFALSGFLVSNSFQRTRLHEFVTLRIIRLVPALAVEITLSALLIGAVFTALPWTDYFTNPQFYAYFLNIIGIVHRELPGVFADNAAPNLVNGQLWTIPYELECYLALILLSVFALIGRRGIFLGVLIALAISLTLWKWHDAAPDDMQTDVGGRVLVLCFLAAVAIFLYRDKIPYSAGWAIASAFAALILLPMPATAYLAAFPIAYLTVWLGLSRPPAIPFGDLSYGIFLFHFPVEQTVMHLFPGIHAWWPLTLIALPVTIAFAWLSWNVVESPVLARKKVILRYVDRAWSTLAAPLDRLSGKLYARAGGVRPPLDRAV